MALVPDARRWLYAVAVAAVLGIGVWLFWPTLDLGLFADDYTALAMMDGSFASHRSALDLFNFADGTAADVARLQRLGSLPWWAPSDFRVSFLRPLSSALWYVDRALFGVNLPAYHAHSIAAWALLVIAASALYRRLFSLGVAAIATLMFAVDDSHHFTVIWLSNRGGLYALMIGVLALLSHLRWRTQARPAYAWLSAGLCCVGLAFGEWVFPMFAYIFAFEVAGASDGRRARVLGLLPAGLPCIAFLVGRALLGYGARGSGAYVDPGAEPARFALALFQRVPVFVADMLFNIPSSWWDQGTPWRDAILDLELIPPRIWMRTPSWPIFHAALGLLAFIALLVALRFCWTRLAQSERWALRWLLLGSLLALTPVVGSFPSTRLTLAAYLGLAPLLSLLARELLRGLGRATRASPLRWFVAYGVLVCLLWMQVVTPLRDDVAAEVDDYAGTTAWVNAADLDPARLAEQRVFLVGGAEFTTSFFFSYIWHHSGKPLPRSYYPLTAVPFAQSIERPAPNELIFRALGGEYLGSGREYMFRAYERHWREGEATQLEGLRVSALKVEHGLPLALRMQFERSVDDPSYVFLFAGLYGLERLPLPAVGASRQVPQPAFPSWIRLERGRMQRRIEPLPEMVSYASPPGFVMFSPDPRLKAAGAR